MKTSQINFLDTLVSSTENGLKTKVYIKPNNNGVCMNGDSECPEVYKTSVINSYLLRAYRFSENWIDFNMEIDRIKKLLINNNFSNTMVDRAVAKFVSKMVADEPVPQIPEIDKDKDIKDIIVLYKNQMHSDYKLDETVLRNIINKKSLCHAPREK